MPPVRPTWFLAFAALLGVGFEICIWGTTAGTIPVAHNATADESDGDMWSLDVARNMVARTRGYYARDYSLHLGWNNMRYIIEAALLHADLLNRTLVVPSYVYARACEFEIHACAAFTTMVNRNDAFGLDEWRNLPIDQQMGFKVPIGIMLDLAHLRKRHSVVTLEEYLLLHNLSASLELSNGHWHPFNYHKTSPPVSLHIIKNGNYDPKSTVRVDRMPSGSTEGNTSSEISGMLYQRLGSDRVAMPISDATEVLAGQMNTTGVDVRAVLEENGWAVLHTFRGSHGEDWMKTVVSHMQEVAPRSRLRGLVDEYASIDTDVLLLRGEIHLFRKPGSLLFTSTPPRDDFVHTVLFDTRPPEAFRSLALKLHSRLEARVDGRMWMGVHMRRKDFLNMGWTTEWSIEEHLRKLKQQLTEGRGVLEKLDREHDFRTYDIPGVELEHKAFDRNLPITNDPFYLATDARTEANKKYLRDNGAILIDDLLTLEDRQAFGWPIMLTDVLAVLEQAVLSHSAVFVGNRHSSVTGGVIDMRAALGADPRTSLVD